jgi:hypothetical protein
MLAAIGGIGIVGILVRPHRDGNHLLREEYLNEDDPAARIARGKERA